MRQVETTATRLSISALERIARDNKDGFTVNTINFQPVTSGFSASYIQTRDSFQRKGLEHVLNFAQSIDCQIVGGWYESKTNKYHYDANKIFALFDDAISFAIDNEQIAIFDLTNFLEINMLDYQNGIYKLDKEITFVDIDKFSIFNEQVFIELHYMDNEDSIDDICDKYIGKSFEEAQIKVDKKNYMYLKFENKNTYYTIKINHVLYYRKKDYIFELDECNY